MSLPYEWLIAYLQLTSLIEKHCHKLLPVVKVSEIILAYCCSTSRIIQYYGGAFWSIERSLGLGLAIQLAGGIKKACVLCDSIQVARHGVRVIHKDLHAISDIDDIRLEENQFMFHSDLMIEARGSSTMLPRSLNLSIV
ncbi:hypothetical protein EAF04_008717 [Stromatinia cepivora]|nr:hypothetical protein EAF04_008717 [Stromatinia cepivora]